MRIAAAVLTLAAAVSLALALLDDKPAAQQLAAPAGPTAPSPEAAALRSIEQRTRAEDERIYAALAGDLAELSFEQTPFEQTLRFLAEAANVNVVVHWQVLEDAGVARGAPLTLTLKNLPVERMLREVLDIAGSDTPLGYEVRDGLVLVATREHIERQLVTRTYAVGDLMRLEAGRLQRLHNAESAAAAAGGHTADSTATDANAGDATVDATTADAVAAARRRIERAEIFLEAAGAGLADLLSETTAPDSWRVNGGSGSARVFGDTLVIRQSRSVHREIERLLGDLRQAVAADMRASAAAR